MSIQNDGTDIYIDTITITNNSGGYFTGVNTTASLSSFSISSGLSTSSGTMSYMTSNMENYGLKFTIQLRNRYNAEISASEMAKYSVEICTRSFYQFYDEVNEENVMKTEQIGDIDIFLPTTALAADGSVYVGHDLAQNAAGNSSAISVVGTWKKGDGTVLGSTEYPVYIPDQFKANSINAVIATDFILRYDGSIRQSVGKNSNNSILDGYFNSGSASQLPAFFIDYKKNGSSNTTAASTDTGGTALKAGHYRFHHSTDTDGKPTGNNTGGTNYKSFSTTNYQYSDLSMQNDGTDIYIDTVSITNNSGGYFTGVNTTASLSSFSISSGLSTSSGTMSYMTSNMENYGLKFTIQLRNRYNAEISASEMAKYSVEICTRSFYQFYDEVNEENVMKTEQIGDIDIFLPTTALAADGSVYVGHDLAQNAAGNSSAISVVGTWKKGDGTVLGSTEYPVYIPDQFKANSINAVIATDFILRYDGSIRQSVGKNSNNSILDGYFNSGSASQLPAFFIDYKKNGSSNTTAASTDTGGTALKAGHYSFKHSTDTDGKPTGNNTGGTNYKSFNTNNYQYRDLTEPSLTQSIMGDPHIKTLDGEYYEFDYLGSFRLLEDTVDGEKLIINGKSEPGPARWKNNQYIKKLFIQKGENYILIDMGFRGEEVTVFEEKGFIYTEKELDFHKDAKRYSLTSRYKTTSRTEPVTEDLPRFIRNKINFTIDDNNKNPLIFFEISNVNEYNLQPCRLHIKLANRNAYSKNAKGCLISRKHAPVSKLNDIKSCESIDVLSIEDITEIPDLEINPILRNKKWK